MCDENIGFIGGGVMASAMINGIIKAGVTIPQQIHVSDPSGSNRF